MGINLKVNTCVETGRHVLDRMSKTQKKYTVVKRSKWRFTDILVETGCGVLRTSNKNNMLLSAGYKLLVLILGP